MRKALTFGLATVGAIAFGAVAIAQNLSPTEQLDARARVETAVALAEIAEADGDGDALLVAAKMLAGAGKVAKRDRNASGTPTFYSVGDLAAAAKSLGADGSKADEIAAAEATDRGYCYWEFQCGTFECGWVYLCQ